MLEVLRYETHGHSTASDGFETPAQVARMARGKVEIITLSDHNSVRGQYEFLDEVKRINDEGHYLIGIPATEVSTTLGHMTIACVDPSYNERFLRWASGTKLYRAKPEDLIRPAVEDLNCTITFTHPEIGFVSGIRMEDLMRLLEQLDGEFWGHIGLEVENSSASIIPIKYQLAKARVERANAQLRLATIAGSDYHTARVIGRRFTEVPLVGGKVDILRVFKARNMRPSGRFMSPVDLFFTILGHGYPFVKHALGFYSENNLDSKSFKKSNPTS